MKKIAEKCRTCGCPPKRGNKSNVVFISAFGHGGQTRPRLGKMNISTVHQMMLIKDCGLFLVSIQLWKLLKLQKMPSIELLWTVSGQLLKPQSPAQIVQEILLNLEVFQCDSASTF